jgi:hypothetical protein
MLDTAVSFLVAAASIGLFEAQPFGMHLLAAWTGIQKTLSRRHLKTQ